MLVSTGAPTDIDQSSAQDGVAKSVIADMVIEDKVIEDKGV
jgi:hypothetical protein